MDLDDGPTLNLKGVTEEESWLCQLTDHVRNKHDWDLVPTMTNSTGYSSLTPTHDPIHDYNF